ncbi:uncharacterized protein DFL_001076 [Arthrobotrys flagrans]|uniref:Cytochrome c oxidase subunit n=1 Tax=Arthrobotrys flagrans TaxID=97331 RepID=A0A437AG53_ARTFL|nr:hypothetical protein DFL_001076 [Arthrobotrys flagrans]
MPRPKPRENCHSPERHHFKLSSILPKTITNPETDCPPAIHLSLIRAPLRAGNPAARQILLRRNYASQAGSTFTKEREAVKAHAAQSSELWRKLSLYVAIPALILSSINAYNLWNEHWEHESHLPPPEERPQYPYLNIRVKRYPWGDGDKTLFWNDNVNYKKSDD